VEQINSRLKSTGWSGRRRDHFHLLNIYYLKRIFFTEINTLFHLAQQRQHKRERERERYRKKNQFIRRGRRRETIKNKHNHIEKKKEDIVNQNLVLGSSYSSSVVGCKTLVF